MKLGRSFHAGAADFFLLNVWETPVKRRQNAETLKGEKTGVTTGGSRSWAMIVVLLLFVVVAAAGLAALTNPSGDSSTRRQRIGRWQELPFDGAASYEHLKTLCSFGRRPSGSPGMEQQREFLLKHFRQHAEKVELQEFKVRHPRTGEAVEMVNIIASWRPEKSERILLCAHYDTRPFPDQDPRNPGGIFLGANDGASGVALLMQLATDLPDLDESLGLDVVLFDGEELVYQEGDPYFYGSKYFAQKYAKDPDRGYVYRCGALLDMVGGLDLVLRRDFFSHRWRDVRPVVDEIWSLARKLGVREFNNSIGRQMLDDHVPLHEIAGLRVCDLLGFEYRYWHTEGDVPAACSPEALAKVGYVVKRWLELPDGPCSRLPPAK